MTLLQEFDKFKFMKKEASVPKVVDFTKDYKSLKNCFEIVVTEDENENSSDEEDFNSEDDKIESMFDNEDNLLPPPSAVDFPVAPSSPEIKDSDLMFQFLEQVNPSCGAYMIDNDFFMFRRRMRVYTGRTVQKSRFQNRVVLARIQ